MKNTIHILTHAGKEQILAATVQWWQSKGWHTQLVDNTGHLPAVGRNRIIQQWRNSSEDTTLYMCDDDITLYTHRYLTESFLVSPPPGEVYTLNSNQQMHHQKLNSTGWDNGEHHWSITDEICKFYAISNRHVPLQDTQLVALEDRDWAWQCAERGITTKRLNTVFLREQSMHTHSLFGPQNLRRQLYAQAEAQLKSKWKYHRVTDHRRHLGILD